MSPTPTPKSQDTRDEETCQAEEGVLSSLASLCDSEGSCLMLAGQLECSFSSFNSKFVSVARGDKRGHRARFFVGFKEILANHQTTQEGKAVLCLYCLQWGWSDANLSWGFRQSVEGIFPVFSESYWHASHRRSRVQGLKGGLAHH